MLFGEEVLIQNEALIFLSPSDWMWKKKTVTVIKFEGIDLSHGNYNQEILKRKMNQGRSQSPLQAMYCNWNGWGQYLLEYKRGVYFNSGC